MNLNKKNKILIIGSTADSLINFRGDLIKYLAKDNCIIAISGYPKKLAIQELKKINTTFESINLSRRNLNPIKELVLIYQLYKKIRTHEPKIIIAYTIKPVIWTGIILSLIKNRIKFFPIITGLGYGLQGGSLFRNILSIGINFLYGRSLNKAKNVFFQNEDNKNLFIKNNLVSVSQSIMVRGSGVNLNKFKYSNISLEKFTFIMISRILKEKGVIEYLKAARILKRQHPEINFILAGPIDYEGDYVKESLILEFVHNGIIDYIGNVNEVSDLLSKSTVCVLPSYHEGLPRILLESLAVGRPILTTNVTGCRETIFNNKNGILVEPKNYLKLYEGMQYFVKNKDKLIEMSKNCRQIAEEYFDVEIINNHIRKTIFYETYL